MGNQLGTYLRARRTRLDPTAFGFGGGRRRTPGLRREEVASRTNISPTWYTWLEQGRGGAPSADVLDWIAKGLMLTEPEREHLYMLGLGRLPEARYQQVDGITPRLKPDRSHTRCRELSTPAEHKQPYAPEHESCALVCRAVSPRYVSGIREDNRDGVDHQQWPATIFV